MSSSFTLSICYLSSCPSFLSVLVSLSTHPLSHSITLSVSHCCTESFYCTLSPTTLFLLLCHPVSPPTSPLPHLSLRHPSSSHTLCNFGSVPTSSFLPHPLVSRCPAKLLCVVVTDN
ncbi:hypothetical protein E2C01_096445 [Portunus trituberculatus]|uniref:Uncharacterized protein n=1 Tax=Portunus trituberculatus TaxID=210409 RepID=A0A5B7K710_PORTR|nr:hypothetical protein [Portunus trituberculatus]